MPFLEKLEWVAHRPIVDPKPGETAAAKARRESAMMREFNSIYSIDAHPDATRFATGGGDHLVKIWRWPTPIVEGDQPQHQPAPAEALLASLKRHEGAVYCVRFSPSGRHLASAGADGSVVVWERRPDLAKVACHSVSSSCEYVHDVDHTIAINIGRAIRERL